MNRVLVADDDRAVRESLERALHLEGYDVTTACDGVEALTQARRQSFRALVVDVSMPHVDGVAVCRVLRADGDSTPLLMLTARAAAPDRIAGLDAGADDYLTKPFDVHELLARLRALLRRTAPDPDEPPKAADPGRDLLRVGPLRISAAARRAWCGRTELSLSRTEFDLLELLACHEGIVLDHAGIYRDVWGSGAAVDPKNLATYIGYLRRKLAAAGAPDLIHTVRGVGYAVRRP
ncbi:response regulator transcription factor [Streptomyces sp. NPDC091294]|uniref:response regulator transcription factor n=1 Tax=Streptomyces sp. NPDC091294 TaxID=3365992 RepID=UPI00380BB48C